MTNNPRFTIQGSGWSPFALVEVRPFWDSITAFFEILQLTAICLPTPTTRGAPTAPLVKSLLAERWISYLANAIRRSHRSDSSVPTRVGDLVERLLHCAELFGPASRERYSSRRDGEHFAEVFSARTWCGRWVCTSPITHTVTDTVFQDDSCSTITHDLLCVGGTDTTKYWFMTAVEDWPEVTEYQRACDGSNTIHSRSMSLQELSQAPFDVYFYKQRKGDLVILPPRRLAIHTHRITN